MIRILGKIPREKIIVAVSGGVDSMVALDFLRGSKNKVEAAFFHHGNSNSERGFEVVQKYCRDNDIVLHFEKIKSKQGSDESPEEYWRRERYAFLESLEGTVVTAHHIDDVVETYIFSCLNGNPKLIPYKRNNIIRPFLLTSKEDFLSWSDRKSVPFSFDLSNNDERYMRNYIRKNIIPQAYQVNKGLRKMIRKKVLDKFGLNA